MSKRSDPGGRVGWLTLDTYLAIQAQRLEDFRNDGFLIAENLSLQELRADRLLVTGRVHCRGGLFVDVEEFLTVRLTRGRFQVRSARYSFHAGVEGSSNRPVFRFDNHHPYTREGHADAHHKHVYDHKSWTEVTPPVWIGENHWPRLSDVIEELRQWWETTGQHLDLGQRNIPSPGDRR